MIQLIGLVVAIVFNLLSAPTMHISGYWAGISGGGPVGKKQPSPAPTPQPSAISITPVISP
jgi:hypothetical protein